MDEDSFYKIINDMRMDYSFALRGMNQKIGGYINRIEKQFNLLRGALELTETQRKENKRLYEIAKTAIREVQCRMSHDGVVTGSFRQYWNILEKGFNGTYRNDYKGEL